MLTARRLLPCILLVTLPIISSFCIDMYLPAYPAIANSFQVHPSLINLSMSAYLIGLAVGQLIFGPISDRFGRKKLLLLGMILFIMASFLCTLANSLTAFLFTRFLQAFGACSCIVLCRSMVADLYPPEKRVGMLGLISAANIFSPALAPLFGGYVVTHFNWQMIFLIITLLGVLTTVGIFYILPETLTHPDPDALKFAKIKNNVSRLFGSPVFSGCLISIGLLYATSFVWINCCAHVLLTLFKIPANHFGEYFILPASGSTLGAIAIIFIRRYSNNKQLMWLGYSIILTNLIFLNVLSRSHELSTPIEILIPIAIIFFCISCVQPLQITLATKNFADIAGLSMGIIGFTQSVSGGIVGFLTSTLYETRVSSVSTLMFMIAIIAFTAFVFTSSFIWKKVSISTVS